MKRLPTIDFIMELAARESIAAEYECIEPRHLLIAILKISQIDAGLVKGKLDDEHLMSLLLDELDEVRTILESNGTDPKKLVRQIRADIGKGGTPFQGGTIHRTAASKEIFKRAANLAAERQATFLNAAHLLQAIIEREPAYGLSVPNKTGDGSLPADSISLDLGQGVEIEVVEEQPVGADPVNIVHTALRLRRELQKSVFGQDQAIIAFLDYLFSSEIIAGAKQARRSPKAAFLFAGPPGVGKTHLARCAARALMKPFKRIDMSSFQDLQDAGLIVGVHKSVGGFQPGILTGFAARNPDCFILVRKIEEAHPSVVRLLEKVLEEGELEDQFAEQTVSFSDAVIIFTTSAGEAPYRGAATTATSDMNMHHNKAVVMDLLKKEQDPVTGKPVLPGVLFSASANVTPIILAPLGVNAFIQVAESEMNRTGALLKTQYMKKIEYGPDVPLCLVLQQGLGTIAGTLRSEVESFVTTEIFNFFKICKTGRLRKLMQSIERISFELDARSGCPEEIAALLTTPNLRVLLLADPEIEALWPESIPGVDWMVRSNDLNIGNFLQKSDIDLVLIDLMLGAADAQGSSEAPGGLTMAQFDYVPWAASGLASGRQLLSTIHSIKPGLPCFLISYTNRDHGAERPTVDNELVSACIRSGQAQGVVETGYVSATSSTAEKEKAELQRRIREVARAIYLEKALSQGDYPVKVLSFETVPAVSRDEKTIRIRLRNLKLVPATPALGPSRREGPIHRQHVPSAAGEALSDASSGLPAAALVEPNQKRPPTEEHVAARVGTAIHECPHPNPLPEGEGASGPGALTNADSITNRYVAEARQERSESGTVSDDAAIEALPRHGMDDAEDSLEFRDTLLQHYLEEDSEESEFVIDDAAGAHQVKPVSETPEEGKKEVQPSPSDSDTDEFTWD